MKLFAFVRRARRSPAPAPEDTSTAAAAAPAEKRRRRPSSSSSSGSAAAAAWKPTLGAISEDAAMTTASMAKAQAKPAAAGPIARARSPRRATTRAPSYDNFRHYGQPTVLPAFTPTAFLF